MSSVLIAFAVTSSVLISVVAMPSGLITIVRKISFLMEMIDLDRTQEAAVRGLSCL